MYYATFSTYFAVTCFKRLFIRGRVTFRSQLMQKRKQHISRDGLKQVKHFYFSIVPNGLSTYLST